MTIRNYFLCALVMILSFFLGGAEAMEADFFTVYDEEERVIFYTGEYTLAPGDRYISQENREYLIYSVQEEEKRAEARDLGSVDLLGHRNREDSAFDPSSPGPLFAGREERTIGIYHTHTEESFVPTSGTHDKPGEGDIFEVGVRFKEVLEEKGIKVFHDLTKHEPRDAASYDRSKPTAMGLIEKDIDAIFDIHRDGVPNKEEYTTEIDGESVSMIRFVVGRQNPNMAVIEDFAKELKAAADKREPGLIKGILFSNGKYNQELHPKALLFEIGTHLNTLEEAERGAALMASVVADFFYGAEAQGLDRDQEQSAYVTILWLLLVVFLGGFLFLYLNEGSLPKALEKLTMFFRRASRLGNDERDREE